MSLHVLTYNLKRMIALCHSAWGPNADRHGNSLNCLRKEGSNSEADLQLGRTAGKLVDAPRPLAFG